jgi:hypothetical protein
VNVSRVGDFIRVYTHLSLLAELLLECFKQVLGYALLLLDVVILCGNLWVVGIGRNRRFECGHCRCVVLLPESWWQ